MLEGAVRSGVVPNAQHHLWKWHKVNPNYTLPAKRLITGLIDKRYIQSIIYRLYNFCTSTESEKEEQYRINEIQTFIKSSKDKITQKLYEFILYYWKNSFEKMLPKLCQRHYMFIPRVSVC